MDSWVPSPPGDRGGCADASTQVVAEAVIRGKSELHRAGCWVIPRRREPTESATERRPPTDVRTTLASSEWRALRARVKRCGKSAPAVPVTGPAWQTPPGARPNRGGGVARSA